LSPAKLNLTANPEFGDIATGVFTENRCPVSRSRFPRRSSGKPEVQCPRRHRLNPTQMSVPNFDQNDERVTCVSCRFRYPSVRRFCPMCGVLASPEKAILDVHSEASGGGLEIKKGTEPALRASPNTGLRKLITLAVSTVLLVCTLSYFSLRGQRKVKTPTAVPSVGATSPQPSTQSASAAVDAAEKSTPENRDFGSAKPRPDRTSKAEDDNPMELWSRVGRGNTGAEVALAKLYLRGIAVARSCEQAHVLLLAASRNRSKAADSLLAGAYAQQCQ
jgi:hypothetical protein